MSSDLESVLLPHDVGPRTNMFKDAPAAQYSKFSEKLRQSAPSEFQCSVFCGGRKCRYENSTGWKSEEMAIDGLFSHWITDNILAMARPNTTNIQKHKMIEQFIKHGIKTVFNLQQPGEHASCGYGLGDSGFSYEPQQFMEKEIFFYNFRWKDYGTVSNSSLLDMVKVMAFAIQEGKVSVHCHAGLGRTGVLIACYLVYSLRCKPNDAIRYIRLKRPHSIQTRNQILCVQEFGQYIHPLFCVYSFGVQKAGQGLGITHLLSKQRKLLHGLEARHLKFIPKLLYVICERLLMLCGCYSTTSRASTRQGALVDSISYRMSAMYSFANSFLSASPEEGKFRPLSQLSVVESISGSSDSSLDSGMGQSAGSRQNSDEADYINGVLHEENAVEEMHLEHEMYEGDYDAESEDESLDSMLLEDAHDMDLTLNTCYRELSSQAELRAMGDPKPGPSHVSYNSRDVALSLMAPHHNLHSDFQAHLKQYQRDLNSSTSAWDRLERETDLMMLTALLWSWLEHLKEPLLNKQDLIYIVLRPEKTLETMKKLERGARFTMEYLIHFIARLQLESDEMTDNLLRRLVASITHQCLTIKGILHPVGSSWKKMREGTSTRVVLFIRRIYDTVLGLPPKSMANISQGGKAGTSKEKNYRGINLMAYAIGRSGMGPR